jgi:hypothetical protein
VLAVAREPLAKAQWVVSLYPEAGEAGGTLRTLAAAQGGGPGGADPARAKEEAARRARTKVRRYCAANRLNRLGTLTYAGAGCHDPRQARADAGQFFRELRHRLGGDPLPYLWVPEWHPRGHGLHLHFAVGRYLQRSVIQTAWGRGFVHIKLLGDLPVGAGQLGEARIAGRYLGKYVTKDADHSLDGLHRYEVAQGFQPRRQTFTARTGQQALAAMSEQMTRAPEYVWWSSDQPEWQGPPAVWASWAA